MMLEIFWTFKNGYGRTIFCQQLFKMDKIGIPSATNNILKGISPCSKSCARWGDKPKQMCAPQYRSMNAHQFTYVDVFWSHLFTERLIMYHQNTNGMHWWLFRSVSLTNDLLLTLQENFCSLLWKGWCVFWILS